MFEELYDKPFAIIYNKVCKNTIKTPYTIFSFQAYDFNRENKFSVLKKFLKNSIHNINDQKTFGILFRKTQAVQNVFNRFYANHCVKKAIRYNCNLDLNLEPLFNFKEKNKFSFIQENTRFIFSNKDMLKIIKSGLLSHDSFFSQCHMPRNPYTNLDFNPCILYNFYFYLQKHNFKIPELFRRFFNESFDINIFLRKNESYVREDIIDNYALQLTLNELYEEIIMFLRIVKLNCLYIHIDFSKKQVVNAFQKIYTDYLHSRFDLTEDSRAFFNKKMQRTLNKFISENKTFGRIILKRTTKKSEHHYYKIHNLLSLEIPDFQSINNIYKFMEMGNSMYFDDLDSDINSILGEDDELTQDEFDYSDDDMSPLENILTTNNE